MTDPNFTATQRLQCEGTVVSKKWHDKRRCWRVGTVRVGGKVYCITCAKKTREPK